MRHSRKGFTLLELLAVIGIILILISMAILGYRQIDKAATAKATKVTLANAQALIAEYEINTPLNNNPVFGVALTGAPNDVNPGGSDRNSSQAVTNTQIIMQVLSRVPKNKQVLAALPARSILANSDGTAFPGPVLLDGWKNPIIFVPASGLVVNLAQGAADKTTGTVGSMPYIVRTSGVYPIGSAPLPSGNDRPFFASAGQDGNFTNGDDNLYSFQP
ncbi:MAG TPA: type II secretion system protein [Tepidisphaeraceae bacterium]|nr:type II secretion system protein [Tepidisphaeraceae bacterium]